MTSPSRCCLRTKKVKENFNSLVVVTDDGKVRSGIKLRQTDTDLLLRDAEDNEIAIPLTKIEEQSNGVSIKYSALAVLELRAPLLRPLCRRPRSSGRSVDRK